ncbi:bifunctional 2-methylcitrate synthase/citrate synthase [Paracraurococcus lichenis]|uniref:citrate synthase (unknown stereospecificity) n=1 Tax=Paracraurococcus lichenis TaxID=3064888 RepID=A0ABT9DT54_9PROT|nr:bifunctional 2-methylcitrate synthase/citrate synthase [Paracraurococcus sp. LOR1-02]MDO9707081.1 bifunctional 2-methylcitrate synthase/citrate synthase [Paracraurococcus sp. LOR1-02]
MALAPAGPGGAAEVTLRPGRAADAPALAAIHRAARAQALPRLREPWDEASVAAWLRHVLLARHRVRVAEAAGRPVAYLGLDEAEAMVLHLYVAPPWQGRGIGRRLMEEAKAACPGGLALHVFQRNLSARRFYERQGFRAAERRPASANEEGEPDIHYVLTPDDRPDERRERMSEATQKPEIYKGLVGVYADVSSISKVMPETNSLTYRGYAVQDLAENCSFEEVAYLLWEGELPTAAQLAAFREETASQREITPALHRVIREFPKDAHPMDSIRTAVSFMGLEDPETGDVSEAAQYRKAKRLFAKIPTAIGATYRAAKGLDPVAPNPAHSFAENVFNLVQGRVPEPEVLKAFDVSMILYAEHTFNASTYTARLVTSTGADMHGAITAGIAALKGPLHGGANEAVMHMLKEIGDPAVAKEWLQSRFDHRALVMGFGHRVYKSGDSRVPTMKKYAEKMAEVVGDRTWMEISRILAAEMLEKKNIHPNLDFPAGPAYHLMGFEIPLFTPLFVASRVTGWSAHVLEQQADNRLIRPLSWYTGKEQRPVPAMAAR